MCTHLYTCMWKPQNKSGVVPQRPSTLSFFYSTLSFESESLIGLILTKLARLASQQTPGTSLSLPSQERDCKRVPSFPAFLYGFWGSNISAHACKVSSFLNRLSPQPSKAYLYGTHEELGRSSAGESGRGNQKPRKERGTRVLVMIIRTSGWHCLTEVRRTSALE